MFSDGVTETFDPGDQAFGEENLMNLLNETRHEMLDIISIKLKDKLYDFRGNITPSDDTTFFAIEYTHTESSPRLLFSGISRDEAHKRES